MEKAAYFIFILCGIFSQGICKLSEGNNGTSANILIRQKRIVGGVVRRFAGNDFLLNVFLNGNYHCPATLLTANVAISSAACFMNHNTQNMRVSSRVMGGTTFHNIVGVFFLDPNFNPAHPTVRNLALVRFALPINFRSSYNQPITIYSGNVASDHSTVRVVSWGRASEVGSSRIPAEHFLTFPLFLTSFEYCQHIYPNEVGNGNICAIGSNAGEYCDTHDDTGIPLTKGNELLGIFVYRCDSCPTRPNVFMNLMDHDIRRWIHQHVPSLRLF